jgi:hypothetical protein
MRESGRRVVDKRDVLSTSEWITCAKTATASSSPLQYVVVRPRVLGLFGGSSISMLQSSAIFAIFG